MFRCFPPSSPQQLDIKTDDPGAFDDLGTLDDPEAFPKTDSLNVERSNIRLSDCGPQGSPVAEAGPGVSYPGYKQYCRCLSYISVLHVPIMTKKDFFKWDHDNVQAKLHVKLS